MSSGFPFFRSALAAELDALRRSWGWLLAWGTLLIVGGVAALVYPAVATVISVEVFGVLMLFAAGGQLVVAVTARRWGGTLTSVLWGVLYFFAGIILLERPLLGAAGYTLFLAMLFFAVGVVRIVAAVTSRFSGWGWSVVSGVVAIFLAILIWRDMPAAALWVIGTFVGIDLIFAGWSWVMLALAARNIPSTEHKTV